MERNSQELGTKKSSNPKGGTIREGRGGLGDKSKHLNCQKITPFPHQIDISYYYCDKLLLILFLSFFPPAFQIFSLFSLVLILQNFGEG